MMKVDSLDHLVLTVTDIEATVGFYCDVLGMQAEVFHRADGSCRTALKFGQQKINLHKAGHEFEPNAEKPTPGSADLCFLSDVDLADWLVHFANNDVDIEQDMVARTGANGPIISIYVRDPDRNLIEISNRV